MLNFCDGTSLAKRFGDFGGNEDMSDFEFGRLNPDIDGIRKTIESDQFEKVFREILPVICDGFSIKSFELAGGRKLYAAPALGKKYALAARLAFAKCIGKQGVAFGSSDKELVQAAVKASAGCGLKIRVILGKALASEPGFADGLRERGAEVDDKTCVELFDEPHAYLEVPFTHDAEYYVLEVEANYGPWPRPAMTGVFAGLYGADLLEKLDKVPEACVVPITTGTEAIGVFKALKGTGCRLATCEGTVAQEFHIYDTNLYTLSTRSADVEGPNTSICPELCYMWRKNKVLRLGCDRIYPVDCSALESTGLPEAALRAATLAFEAMECSELLVLEV